MATKKAAQESEAPTQVVDEKPPRKTRADKIAEATAGKTFTLVQAEAVEGEFTCICGGKGKHAYLVVDQDGVQIKVGTSCLEHVGIERPKKPRKVTRGPNKGKTKAEVDSEGGEEVPMDGVEATEDDPFGGLDL